MIGAAFSFVSFFIAVDKESDLPWVNHPLPLKQKEQDPRQLLLRCSTTYIHVGVPIRQDDNKKKGQSLMQCTI